MEKMVLNQVIVLLILMSIGYLAGKFKVINEEISLGLTDILIMIALPALLISSFNIKYNNEILIGLMYMVIFSIIVHILTIFVSNLLFFKYKKEQKNIMTFGAVFSNGGFMGLPLVGVLFGQEALLYASVYMVPYHLFMWTYGENLLKKEKSNENILYKFTKNPILIGIAIGVIFFILNINFPYPIEKSISLFAGLTLPLSMLILGYRISLMQIIDIVRDIEVYYTSVITLIIVPLIAYSFLKIVNAPIIIRNTLVFMQSLPSATFIAVLAQKHNSDIALASKITVISHILSIITIPIISLLF